MKKGINAWAFPEHYSLEQCFAQAKHYQFDGIELNMGEKDSALPIFFGEREIKAIMALKEKYLLEIPSISTDLHWRYPLSAYDDELRQQGIHIAERMLEAARCLGASTILLVPGLVDEETPYDRAYERALDALRHLARVAEEKKVYIGIENVWNKFLLSPLEMKAFINEVNSPWVGVYFDVGNVVQLGYPEQWIKILNQHICAVHVKDYKRDAHGLSGFVPLLAGDISWDKVMKALRDVGYEGYITAELLPYHHFPEQLLKETAEKFDRLIGAENKQTEWM